MEGIGDRLEARPVLRAMLPDQRYAVVHTHPEGISFSATDATVLVAHAPTLHAVAAVGGPGMWYVLSIDPHRKPPSPADVLPAFATEWEALASTYQHPVHAGVLTRREARREHTHEVWERLAPALGLRYDRV